MSHPPASTEHYREASETSYFFGQGIGFPSAINLGEVAVESGSLDFLGQGMGFPSATSAGELPLTVTPGSVTFFGHGIGFPSTIRVGETTTTRASWLVFLGQGIGFPSASAGAAKAASNAPVR